MRQDGKRYTCKRMFIELGRVGALSNDSTCSLPMLFQQAPNLVAMLGTRGDKKKEMCKILYEFKHQLGPTKLMEVIECGGDFPEAFKNAKQFCALDGTQSDSIYKSESEMICDLAKEQVQLCLVRTLACMSVNMTHSELGFSVDVLG